MHLAQAVWLLATVGAIIASAVMNYHYMTGEGSGTQGQTSVLFELIGTRYERRSMLITANQAFGQWGKVFPDKAMTLAAIDRLVHHATILEMNVESYRAREALERKRAERRSATTATIKTEGD